MTTNNDLKELLKRTEISNSALIEAHKDYIKVLRERIATRDEDINFYRALVSDKNYKIKQSRETITKLKDMLDDVYGNTFIKTEFVKVIDDITEILNKPIWE